MRREGWRNDEALDLLCRIADGSTRWLAPLVDLAMRVAMADIFFRSGLQKIMDWPATLFLFAEEYRVPLLPNGVAASLAALTELSMPVLLVLGLGTRLAALPLLGMTLIIQFVLGASNPAYDHPQHFLWMIILAALVTRGAGTLSIDHLLVRRRTHGRQG